MARVLIVACGGRGCALARELVAAGHAVRGTTRDPAHAEAIRAAGAEPYVGGPRPRRDADGGARRDDDVVLLADRRGPPTRRDLHGGRLRMLFEKLVDTPVRGVVYEAAGTVPDDVLRAAGASDRPRRARRPGRSRWRSLEADPGDRARWLEADAGRGASSGCSRRRKP